MIDPGKWLVKYVTVLMTVVIVYVLTKSVLIACGVLIL